MSTCFPAEGASPAWSLKASKACSSGLPITEYRENIWGRNACISCRVKEKVPERGIPEAFQFYLSLKTLRRSSREEAAGVAILWTGPEMSGPSTQPGTYAGPQSRSMMSTASLEIFQRNLRRVVGLSFPAWMPPLAEVAATGKNPPARSMSRWATGWSGILMATVENRRHNPRWIPGLTWQSPIKTIQRPKGRESLMTSIAH